MANFPPEVISYYNPHYADHLLTLIKDEPIKEIHKPVNENEDNSNKTD